jgi:hypothetical protein
MAFAQVFTILYELTVASRQISATYSEVVADPFLSGITRLTLNHLPDLASEKLLEAHPLREYLQTLQGSEDLLGSLVESMHKMVDIARQAQRTWIGLYLLERYCDCLYHAGISGERQKQRALLLQLQENNYGKTRGNVLWTLTNVADDYLENNQFDEAERSYRDALERANYGLGGYPQVKIRFAVFEGLARAAFMRSRVQDSAAAWRHSAAGFTRSLRPSISPRLDKLNEALENLHLAEAEALKRSDFSSRRIARVRLSQVAVRQEIQDLQSRL